ncbi:MAG TPA: UDP-glucose 4-epimerase GalE [Bacteroidia bacterium]|nr:UDP-glucose 4-epimerase GalE [Bacteroidia bacterium]
MKKFVVVTGGSGYIGSHTIVEIFEKTNYEVISIDNFSNSYEEAYDNIFKITNKKVISIQCDICNQKELFEKLLPYANNIHAIIHFAAFKSVPESVNYPFKYYHNNIQSLLNISEFAIIHKISNFIFSSSCSVYGDIKVSPVTENTPLPLPNSPYAHTKQIGEQILQQLVYISKLPLKILSLRYFNPVGAHSSGLIGELPKYNLTGLVPNLIRSVLGKIPALEIYGNDYSTKDGTPIRDYVHVSDIARAHVLAMMKMDSITEKNYYDVINLGTGKGNTVLDVIQTFEKVTSEKVNYKFAPRREGDVEAIYANNDKALKELNWKPEYSLEDMLYSAWQWGKNRY